RSALPRPSPRSLSPSALFFSAPPPPAAFSTLSLHDALPIWGGWLEVAGVVAGVVQWDGVGALARGASRRNHHRVGCVGACAADEDRKSTRLNSSHVSISYAVFCLKKKNKSKT